MNIFSSTKCTLVFLIVSYFFCMCVFYFVLKNAIETRQQYSKEIFLEYVMETKKEMALIKTIEKMPSNSTKYQIFLIELNNKKAIRRELWNKISEKKHLKNMLQKQKNMEARVNNGEDYKEVFYESLDYES